MPRLDLHVHTWFSPDSLTPPRRVVQRCLRVGLSAIAVTDHNTIQGALEVARVAPFPVIIGAEVKTSEGDLVGLFLKEEVPPGLAPLEAARCIKEQGGLVSIPHPFDSVRRSVLTWEAIQQLLPHADMVEGFNARNTFEGANGMAQRLAWRHGVPVVAVSDAHHPLELGRTFTEVPEFDWTAQDFRRVLKEARIVGRRASPLVHLFSVYSKLYKRAWPPARRPRDAAR